MTILELTTMDDQYYSIEEKWKKYKHTSVQLVDSITEHRAMGDGDKWYYDATFADGTVHRIFNPARVSFKTDEP